MKQKILKIKVNSLKKNIKYASNPDFIKNPQIITVTIDAIVPGAYGKFPRNRKVDINLFRKFIFLLQSLLPDKILLLICLLVQFHQ